MCLIVVGALAPLCFLFSVFQNARPPATPRRLGPPLTQRSKNVGPASELRRSRYQRRFVFYAKQSSRAVYIKTARTRAAAIGATASHAPNAGSYRSTKLKYLGWPMM